VDVAVDEVVDEAIVFEEEVALGSSLNFSINPCANPSTVPTAVSAADLIATAVSPNILNVELINPLIFVAATAAVDVIALAEGGDIDRRDVGVLEGFIGVLLLLTPWMCIAVDVLC
jgi:hypothetical protein